MAEMGSRGGRQGILSGKSDDREGFRGAVFGREGNKGELA